MNILPVYINTYFVLRSFYMTYSQELDDSGGTSLGSGGGHGEVAGGFLPTLTHTLEFIHQCKQCNISKV